MNHLKSFESLHDTKTWIDGVMDTCMDIMVELRDNGLRVGVNKSLSDDESSIIIKCDVGSWSHKASKVILSVLDRLTTYMESEGFKLMRSPSRISQDVGISISFEKPDIDRDYIGHLRYLKRYKL